MFKYVDNEYVHNCDYLFESNNRGIFAHVSSN